MRIEQIQFDIENRFSSGTNQKGFEGSLFQDQKPNYIDNQHPRLVFELGFEIPGK